MAESLVDLCVHIIQQHHLHHHIDEHVLMPKEIMIQILAAIGQPEITQEALELCLKWCPSFDGILGA